LTFFI
jgi:hypothetical protein